MKYYNRTFNNYSYIFEGMNVYSENFAYTVTVDKHL